MGSIKSDNMTKIIVVGMQGTGKTSLIKRYTWNQFNQFEQPTLGMQNNYKEVQHTMKRKVKLRIWDIAGQDRYKSLSKNFVRNSLGCIIVCDTQSEQSLSEAIAWKNLIQKESEHSEGLPIILAQNKYDLLPNDVKQNQSDMVFGTENYLNKFGEQNNFSTCIQVSAFDGFQVEELFRTLIDLIIKFQGETNLSSSGQTDNSISLSYYESQITRNPSVNKPKKSTCC